MRTALAGLLASVLLLQGQAPDLAGDSALWRDFSSWVASLQPLPPGHRSTFAQTYGLTLRARGLSAPESARLLQRIQRLHRSTPAREAVYWDALYKLGNGPDAPSTLLQETLRGIKPGRALDAAMGRGRNALYLASQGWQVTGYDLSPAALAATNSAASQAGLKLTTHLARHETFDLGTAQWDLIVCLYNYMDPDDPTLPARLHRALRPNGLVVFQTAWRRELTRPQLTRLWRNFQILRYDDLAPGAVTDEWQASLTYPTLKLVLQKTSLP
ncbi:MAG: class I SAM-dependent methyltransferase [Acidobacteria bacterium]|nr:class I SAM-dependent methyltransferase [Acidobacteriota bacterium]